MKKIRNTDVATYSSTTDDLKNKKTDKETMAIIAGNIARQNNDSTGYADTELDAIEQYAISLFPSAQCTLRISGITGITIDTDLRGQEYFDFLAKIAKKFNLFFGEFGGVKRLKKTLDGGYNSAIIYMDGQEYRDISVFDFFQGKMEKKLEKWRGQNWTKEETKKEFCKFADEREFIISEKYVPIADINTGQEFFLNTEKKEKIARE